MNWADFDPIEFRPVRTSDASVEQSNWAEFDRSLVLQGLNWAEFDRILMVARPELGGIRSDPLRPASHFLSTAMRARMNGSMLPLKWPSSGYPDRYYSPDCLLNHLTSNVGSHSRRIQTVNVLTKLWITTDSGGPSSGFPLSNYNSAGPCEAALKDDNTISGYCGRRYVQVGTNKQTFAPARTLPHYKRT